MNLLFHVESIFSGGHKTRPYDFGGNGKNPVSTSAQGQLGVTSKVSAANIGNRNSVA